MTHDEREQIARADSADALLQHPLIAEALDNYEKELTQAWRNSKPKDAQGREELHRMLLAAAHFRAYLTAVIDSGKVIRARVHQQTLMERARERLSQFRRVA
jgi:hypothetical protein